MQDPLHGMSESAIARLKALAESQPYRAVTQVAPGLAAAIQAHKLGETRDGCPLSPGESAALKQLSEVLGVPADPRDYHASISA